MGKDIHNFEVKHGNKTYILNVKSSNNPSEEAVEICNKIVNSTMNKLLNT